MLRLYVAHVKFARFVECLSNGALGNFVKNYAFIPFRVTTNCFLEMPGYGLTFPVKVSRQIDVVRILSHFFEIGNHFLFTGKNLIVGLPVFFRIDSHSADELLFRFLFLVGYFRLGCHFPRFCSRGCPSLWVDLFSTTACWQITDMPHARFNDEIRAQIFVDRFGFGRGFNDYKRFCHFGKFRAGLTKVRLGVFERQHARRPA